MTTEHIYDFIIVGSGPGGATVAKELAEAKPEIITRGVYESGHPCCKAPIGKVVDENQETSINNLFVSDASVFPSPLGMPPILTIVALSKKLTKYLPQILDVQVGYLSLSNHNFDL